MTSRTYVHVMEIGIIFALKMDRRPFSDEKLIAHSSK